MSIQKNYQLQSVSHAARPPPTHAKVDLQMRNIHSDHLCESFALDQVEWKELFLIWETWKQGKSLNALVNLLLLTDNDKIHNSESHTVSVSNQPTIDPWATFEIKGHYLLLLVQY